MQNPNLIHSVGELFQLFSEWAHIPSAWLARLLNLTEEQFDAHRKDKISPEELGKERILNFAAIAGITIQDLVAIIEKTIKLLKLKPATNFTAGNVRADKKISETKRLNVMDDAMKELMLALGEPEEAEQQQDEWEAFRRELFQDYTEDSPPFAENGKCLTILDKSRRNYAQSLLQQI
jgi:hypothetical protein